LSVELHIHSMIAARQELGLGNVIYNCKLRLTVLDLTTSTNTVRPLRL